MINIWVSHDDEVHAKEVSTVKDATYAVAKKIVLLREETHSKFDLERTDTFQRVLVNSQVLRG